MTADDRDPVEDGSTYYTQNGQINGANLPPNYGMPNYPYYVQQQSRVKALLNALRVRIFKKGHMPVSGAQKQR